VLLERTEIGRYMYAIGGNSEAARLSGVRVRSLRLLGFVIVAFSAAVVGLLLTSQSASYAPNLGISYLLPAFAAVFLGAAVFRPGEFNVLGTVIGVLFLGVIQTGLTMLNLQTYMINLVQGGILITAVLVSRLGQRSSA
jgi:ribose transport system permease protein